MMNGIDDYDDYNENNDSAERIDKEEAVNVADNYVKSNIGKEFTVTGDGHEFYGYYTFHIESGNQTVGMLSVYYYTGEVWYHNWHGELEQVISSHNE